MKCLGHVVLSEGIYVDLEKVEAVMSWQRQQNIFVIQSFLGMTGYCRRFVEDFSYLAVLMTKLTRKGSYLFGMMLMRVPSRS